MSNTQIIIVNVIDDEIRDNETNQSDNIFSPAVVLVLTKKSISARNDVITVTL